MNQTDFLTLARLATRGRRNDVVAFLRGVAGRPGKGNASAIAELTDLLEHEESSPMRLAGALPVDVDSRNELLRVTQPERQRKPVLGERNANLLAQVLRERRSVEELRRASLYPVRTLLFTGPPGVGKTMSAKWLASELGLPLMILDLSTVMSSLLGKSGGNLRTVIEFAKNEQGILLLDEFDSVAKRRADAIEIGELKRLVTVLLQEIDLWPHDRLLIAATNHQELLDPAVWRRFDLHLNFAIPDAEQLSTAIADQLAFHPNASGLSPLLAQAFVGHSFSDVEREINQVRKESLLTGTEFEETLKSSMRLLCKSLKPSERKQIAVRMCEGGANQLTAHEWTGAARDTIRAAMKSSPEGK